jgi:hypothetical protein
METRLVGPSIPIRDPRPDALTVSYWWSEGVQTQKVLS